MVGRIISVGAVATALRVLQLFVLPQLSFVGRNVVERIVVEPAGAAPPRSKSL
jgi:hypothetical protein